LLLAQGEYNNRQQGGSQYNLFFPLINTSIIVVSKHKGNAKNKENIEDFIEYLFIEG
jgi:hypothetical protein